MTRMTGPDCVIMCNLINTHTHTHTHLTPHRGGGQIGVTKDNYIPGIVLQYQYVADERVRFSFCPEDVEIRYEHDTLQKSVWFKSLFLS